MLVSIRPEKNPAATMLGQLFHERINMAKRECRQVVGYKPAGSYILVELLDNQEVLNTALTVTR